jgi:predicted Zn-dependent peptidase
MLNRSIAPLAYPIELIKFPEVRSTSLSNGIEIQSLALGEQAVFKLEFTVAGGASMAEKAGIASLTSSLMKRGTSQRDATKIHHLFDYYGAFWDVQTNLDYATFVLYGLSKHLESLLPYVLEIIQDANFPKEEFEKEIAIEVQKNKLNWQKTAFSASQLLRQELFNNDTYGRISTHESIEAIEHADLVNFHAKHWLNGMPKIFLSGSIGPAEIEAVQRTFEQITTRQTDPAIPFMAQGFNPKVIRDYRENALQSSIRMGMISLTRSNPDYFKFSVLNTLLGGFFGSRLQKNIREEKGFTYGISSSIVPMRRAGYWVVGTDVNNTNVDETCEEIRKEMRRLRTERVGQEELDLVKNYLMGSFTGELTQAFDIAEKIKVIQLENLPLDFYDQFQTQILQCTSEDLLELANKYLDPTKLHEVIVGGR